MLRLAGLFVAAILITGCSSTPSSSPSADLAKKEAQKQLADLDTQLAEYKKKADAAVGDKKIALEKHYIELKAERDKFKVDVDKFASASADAWEDLKKGLDKTGHAMSEAMKKVADDFK